MLEQKLPQISIIIPMYNVEHYIEECLESILKQKDMNYECILVDDGSSDSTLKLVKQLIAHSNNFKIKSRPKRMVKGANTCRNIGFAESKAPYVMFMDADDMLLESCLKNRFKRLEKYKGNDMWVFSTIKTDVTGFHIGEFHCENRSWKHLLQRFIEHDIPWHTMSVVWNKEFLEKIGKWNENYDRLQDVELNVRALLQQPRINFSDSPSDTSYRMSEITNNKALSACYGITQLVKDYFYQISNHNILLSENKEYLEAAFYKLIDNVIFKYIFRTDIKDEQWCRFYLDTLQWIEVDEDDIRQREDVLKEINKKR